MALELAEGFSEALAEPSDLAVVLSVPDQPGLAARVLDAAGDDLYWLDTPPEEDGEWEIPNLVMEPRELTETMAFVWMDAGKAAPELLARIPAIVERHLDAAGGGDGVLEIRTDLTLESGTPRVRRDPLPRPPKPPSAKRPRIPNRPDVADALDRAASNQSAFLDPEDAAAALAPLVDTLLEAAGADISMSQLVVSMRANDALDTLQERAPAVDAAFAGLPLHSAVAPESRDPVVWSGVDATLEAFAWTWRRGGVPMFVRDDRGAATRRALGAALFIEANTAVNRLGGRTWTRWVGQALGAVRGTGGDRRAATMAEMAAHRVAALEIVRWLRDPPDDEGGGFAAVARSVARTVVDPLLADQRETMRTRAAFCAVLALSHELGYRAAGVIADRADDPYEALRPYGEAMCAAALAALASSP